MKKTIIRNSVISFVGAIVIAFISVFFTGTNADILHYALYDFFIIQIFLFLLEIYIDIFSDFKKLMQQEPYRELIQQLDIYEKKQRDDELLDKVLSIAIEECVRYTKMQSIDSCQVSSYMAERIFKTLLPKSSIIYLFCDYKQFQRSFVEIFTEIVVFYDNYEQLYRFFRKFEDLPSVKNKVRFYRRHEETPFRTYFIIDNKYIVLENSIGSYLIQSNSDTMKKYLADFSVVKAKSVTWGKTQYQDSLFLNQSIKEFYGDGNVPDLHLDKISGTYKKILDLGTGAGRLLYHFTDSNQFDITAMDKDDTALSECKKSFQQYSHISYVSSEFNEDSFAPDMFDMVIAFNSLYHTDRASILKVIKRVKMILKKGGYFLFTLKTLEGNETIYKNARELIPEKPENTYIDTAFPDYYLPHHFCNDEEVQLYLNMFSSVIYSEEIPYREHNGDIVQGRGFYFILQK